ncbi:hypothetical protein ABT095_29605 [Kitasatospora sp. NPDC002227]
MAALLTAVAARSGLVAVQALIYTENGHCPGAVLAFAQAGYLS